MQNTVLLGELDVEWQLDFHRCPLDAGQLGANGLQRRLARKVSPDPLVEVAVVSHRFAFLAGAKVAWCVASDKRFPEISWQRVSALDVV
jgi:hypothetical protein